MEQGVANPRTRYTPSESLGVPTHTPNNRTLDKRQKDFIFISAQSVGLDLMRATNGEPISESDLLGLQFRGFLDNSTEEILENSYFDGIDDFNDVARTAYEDYQAENVEKRQLILSEIKESKLPAILFKKVEFVSVKGLSITKKLESGKHYLVKDVGVITDEPVDDDEAITRYMKYKLAKKLLNEARGEVSQPRLIGIAMGIFLEEPKADPNHDKPERMLVNGTTEYGKKISSYQSEVYKASNSVISQADVEAAALAAEMYEFIFPERVKEHYRMLRKAARAPVIINLKQKEQAYQFRTSEISIDIKRRRLLIGETAVKSVIEKGANPDNIYKLGQLLLVKNLEVNFTDPNHYAYKNWQKDDYLAYGQWLLKLIDPAKLNKNVLVNATHLGLGPGPKGIAGTYGNNVSFFSELERPGLSQYGMYNDWEFQDFVEHIKNVATEIGRRPT
ncbi:MAG TPA: hypothetical protein VFP32_02620, partial [Candidatus Saccharimonadales bacterium]|nr:hypothetical protein [Candidatus Saccharimonadales bacterium]